MQTNFTTEPEFDDLYNNYASSAVAVRNQLLSIEGISRDKLDYGKMARDYHTNQLTDITVDQNANANESVGPNNHASEVAKGLAKADGYFLLWKYAKKEYGLRTANKLIRSIWDGELYFHDPTGIQVPYCWAYSTAVLMTEGRPYGQLYSSVPKRADSFIAQVIECTMDLSQEFVGAIAPSDVLINYAWYAQREEKTDKQIINDLQKMVHIFNNKYRVSGQSPFTNLSLFDRVNLEKVFGDYVYPDFTHIDIEYVMHIQKVFGEWFSHGDPLSGLPYRFPIITVNLYVDENKKPVDEDFLDWVSEVNTEKAIFNIYGNDGTKVASCCRLSNDFSRMKYKADTFGNGGLNIGSHRVVTLNLPDIAIQAGEDNKLFFRLLDNRMEKAKKLLIVHREHILKKRVDRGFLKFFNPLQWFSLNQFFSTIGIVGVYEACYFMGLDIKSEEGVEFVEALLKHIEANLDVYSAETGYSFNCEEIPAESAAISLAKKDQLKYGEDIQPFKLYSNQYIPLIVDATLLERIKLSGKFMSMISGGSILHLNVSDQIHTKEQMKKLITVALVNGVEHFAVNYGFAICAEGHVSIAGNTTTCPVCGGDIVDYLTRIIGYFTKVSSWNAVRKVFEFPIRKFKNLVEAEEEIA